MRLDYEICDELWNEDEFSDDSDCDYDTVVKFLPDSEQSDSSDDEDNVNDDSDMQHGTWTKVGAERPHFPFSGKPGLNVHLEDPNNLLDYFQLLTTPELTELISRETNQYAQQFLENTLNLKKRVHHWNNTNR
jgi:hypothetical protein